MKCQVRAGDDAQRNDPQAIPGKTDALPNGLVRLSEEQRTMHEEGVLAPALENSWGFRGRFWLRFDAEQPAGFPANERDNLRIREVGFDPARIGKRLVYRALV